MLDTEARMTELIKILKLPGNLRIPKLPRAKWSYKISYFHFSRELSVVTAVEIFYAFLHKNVILYFFFFLHLPTSETS